MDTGRPAAAQDDGGGSGGIVEARAPPPPTGGSRGVSHHCPRKGMRGAGWRASLPRADVECRCRGVDAAPISRRPAPRAGVLGVAAISPLTKGTHRRSTSGRLRPQRRRLPKPALHPAARCLATAPLVGCSGGRIAAGGAAGIRGGGYARWLLGVESGLPSLFQIAQRLRQLGIKSLKFEEQCVARCAIGIALHCSRHSKSTSPLVEFATRHSRKGGL